jgi:hypothetical protein
MLLFAIASLLSFAQPGQSPIMLPVDGPPLPLDPFIEALKSHSWPLVAAIPIAFLISLSKTGWMSVWLAERIPAWARPWLAPVIGAASFSATAIIAGTDWRIAILQGVEAGWGAVFAHAVIVQGARKGAEVIPQTAKLTAMHGPAPVVDVPPISIRPPSVAPPPGPQAAPGGASSGPPSPFARPRPPDAS